MNPLLESVTANDTTSLLDQESELTRRIDTLTYRQIKDLQVLHNAGRVTVIGRSRNYYTKQLASQAVLDLIPGAVVQNAIDVVT